MVVHVLIRFKNLYFLDLYFVEDLFLVHFLFTNSKCSDTSKYKLGYHAIYIFSIPWLYSVTNDICITVMGLEVQISLLKITRSYRFPKNALDKLLDPLGPINDSKSGLWGPL